jgi:NitT/TauT family transport system ATP-binding protein
MPTSAIFIVTHNIEEAVLLADRVIVLARNPAWVRADFPIELAHPRDRKSPRFVELVDYIYKIMTQPQLALAAPGTGAAVEKPTRQKYQMIPHARVGGVAGLLELLQDRGGKEYLHRLAEVLIMDAEDLLPIIEAAVLLGFATLKDGDVQITPEGTRFAEADILTRKILFRQAALNHIVILQQIDSILHAKTDHSISQEFFYDILDEHFSQDEVERQFDTAMNWGRYAEIFDFDRESHRLILAEPVGEPHPPTTTPVQS